MSGFGHLWRGQLLDGAPARAAPAPLAAAAAAALASPPLAE